MAIPAASRSLLRSLPADARERAQALCAADSSLGHIAIELDALAHDLALVEASLARAPEEQSARRGLLLADLDAARARLSVVENRYQERLLALLSARFAPAA